jgi:hypothetical protein
VREEVRSRKNKVSEDMSNSYGLTSFAVLSPRFGTRTLGVVGQRTEEDVPHDQAIVSSRARSPSWLS